MRRPDLRWLAVVPLTLVLSLASTPTDAAPRTATLRIIAPPSMQFRTLGVPTKAFRGSRTFSLQPGSYVIVQAPPTAGRLITNCTDGQTNQHYLAAGQTVICVFIAL